MLLSTPGVTGLTKEESARLQRWFLELVPLGEAGAAAAGAAGTPPGTTTTTSHEVTPEGAVSREDEDESF